MSTTPVRKFADFFGEYHGSIDPHLPPFNAKGDAMRGNNGITDGTTRFEVPDYKFTRADVGKLFFCDQGGGIRTITRAPFAAGDHHACQVSGTNMAAGSGRGFIFGTDDTAALQKALDHARYAAGAISDETWVAGAFAGETQRFYLGGGRGRLVVLRSGHKYLVMNSKAQFDAGRTSALVLHRRHGLIGMDEWSEIVTMPSSYGDVISNHNSRSPNKDAFGFPDQAYGDLLTLSNFSVFGARKMGGAINVQNGIHLVCSFEGYPQDVDPRIILKDVRVVEMAKNGIHAGGRMNGKFENLTSDYNGEAGFYWDALNDTTIIRLNGAGNNKQGMVVNRCQASTFGYVYLYYNGAGGGASERDTCNLLITADQSRNGKAQYDVVHLQESRGPGLVIENSGQNVFRNLMIRDPGRNTSKLNGGKTPAVDPSGLPAIRGGIYMTGAGASHNSLDARVESQVQSFSTPNYTGTEPLYITGEPWGNVGNIEVQHDLSYTGRGAIPDTTKLGGAGVSNGKNTRLLVDGAALS